MDTSTFDPLLPSDRWRMLLQTTGAAERFGPLISDTQRHVLSFATEVQLYDTQADRLEVVGHVHTSALLVGLCCNERTSLAPSFAHSALHGFEALLDRERDQLQEDLCDGGWASTLLVVERADLDERVRGRGLGLLVVDRLMNTLAGGADVVAMRPEPLIATPSARRRLGRYWAHLGFAPYRRDRQVWTVDQTMIRPTGLEAVAAARGRRDDRWPLRSLTASPTTGH